MTNTDTPQASQEAFPPRFVIDLSEKRPSNEPDEFWCPANSDERLHTRWADRFTKYLSLKEHEAILGKQLHYGYEWSAKELSAKSARIKFLEEEIEALTHEGRQGELEQANVGLAQQIVELESDLSEIYACATYGFQICKKLISEGRTGLGPIHTNLCRIREKSKMVRSKAAQDANKQDEGK